MKNKKRYIEKYALIDSTQMRAREIFKNKPCETLVISNSQICGYGRRGSQWESPAGGLYFSILMKYPSKSRNLLPIFALLSALKAFEKQNIKVKCKWPNDLYKSGKKLGGILTEAFSPSWVGIGVGINANITKKKFNINNISICRLEKQKFINDFLKILESCLKKQKLTLKDVVFLNAQNFLKGKAILVKQAVRQTPGQSEEGIVKGIDNLGRLILDNDKKIEYGSVVLLKEIFKPNILIIAVDIGNTATKIGKIEPNGRIKTRTFPTLLNEKENYLSKLVQEINKIIGKDLKKLKGIAVSSVAGISQKYLNSKLKKEFKLPLIFADKSTNLITIKVKKPSQVGADRICNTIGAYQYYGGNIVVVDLGTANTYDVISSTGEYLGGVIAPGILAMKEALLKQADKLKNVKLSIPKKIIGDETSLCLNSGLYLTLFGQIEATLKAIKKEWKKEFKVILTGGGLSQVVQEMKSLYIVDSDITLKGLVSIWKEKTKFEL